MTTNDYVSLDIDYKIIEHFSNHLYSSPNKAIEELVSNGFDAGAKNVNVFLPGDYTNNVIVWDDGCSMDEEGLQNLWNIANSPKSDEAKRTIEVDKKSRKVIGKFGIGKLASYTVGNQITHLCKTDDKYLLVSVDYRLVKSDLTGSEKFYKTPIKSMDKHEAYKYLVSKFTKLPEKFDEYFERSAWTACILEDLKRHDIYQGRLDWIIGNGLPLRPDFTVNINTVSVKPKLLRTGASKDIDYSDKDFQSTLSRYWKDRKKEGKVTGEIKFGNEKGLNPDKPKDIVNYIDFPSLGRVWGMMQIFRETLLGGRAEENGRSYGFFIMVRGRLINESDEKVTLKDPSFGTFFRTRYVIYADNLDTDLLADRERILTSTPRTAELEVLQRAMNSTARQSHQQLDDTQLSVSDPAQRLPVFSREYYLEPLNALWSMEASTADLKFEIGKPPVEKKPLGVDSRAAEFSKDGSGFKINTDHPYHRAINDQFTNRKARQDALLEFENLAIGEELFKGYLLEIGLSEDRIQAIAKWRDEFFRYLAKSNRKSIYTIESELIEASFKSGKIFENAVAQALRTMGFNADRDGMSGEKDILMMAPAGEASYHFVVEAKGSSEGSLNNDDAEVGGAINHRDQEKADHAIIIARKFAGFDSLRADNDPAILRECKAAGGVSIMQVDALIELMRVVNRYLYPLDQIKEVFTAIESPLEKIERIERLNKPLEDFDYKGLLDMIWRQQGDITKGRDVPVLTLYYAIQDNLSGETDSEKEKDLKIKLSALQAMAYPLIQYDDNRGRVALKQEPQKIAERIMSKLS